MPFKANTPIRHKFGKSKHRVTNWAAYTESLWLSGGLTIYSDVVVEFFPRRVLRRGTIAPSPSTFKPQRVQLQDQFP